MKYLAFILFAFVFLQLVYSQDIEDKQMMIGIKNVDPEDEVDHTVEAVGTYWELDESTWSISTDPLGETSTISTTGNSTFTPPSELRLWPGWNFIWLETKTPNKTWATGFYKVTNDFNDSYFYLDGRDNRYAQNISPYGGPDFFVHLDAGASNERYHYKNTLSTTFWTEIDNLEIIRIWDIKEFDPPSTNSLPDFWDNALLSIDDVNDHPRIAWGPYPDAVFGNIIGYRIYRCANHVPGQSGTFSLFDTVDEDEFEYIDATSTVGNDHKANSYYIKCIYEDHRESIYETSATNTVEIRLEIPAKRSAQSNYGEEGINYVLEQNYPNPFNPATMIHFSINNKSFATLKIYDILGKEVVVLINNIVEAGNHSIEFNAMDLPSGIYLYQLIAGEKSLTKKMILLR
jgi:hypothetical protein